MYAPKQGNCMMKRVKIFHNKGVTRTNPSSRWSYPVVTLSETRRRKHEKKWITKEFQVQRYSAETIVARSLMKMDQIIENSVRMAHPKDGYEVCRCTDSSELYWGVIMTQIRKAHLHFDVLVQKRQPLPFLNGNFNRFRKQWKVIERSIFYCSSSREAVTSSFERRRVENYYRSQDCDTRVCSNLEK